LPKLQYKNVHLHYGWTSSLGFNLKRKKSRAEKVIRWTSKITFSLKGCSSYLSRLKNIIRGYWYKRQTELLVRLHHARKHSRICGFTDVFQRAMDSRSHNFIGKFKQAHSETQATFPSTKKLPKPLA